ncbi:uncharacterized protein LOC107634782 isoform X1 [Arachis ipaensis]|uniref:uncharacterized protein LOC107634782 isoform X1 n=1 Tax=Arachis ipaensis TaxID=130454 RepID=UPI000A2B3999|nr:uncharacterized protein LOC107634782 isoform X1 [Arachis ipaensis]
MYKIKTYHPLLHLLPLSDTRYTIDEGSFSDLPRSSRPPLATAAFDLHRRFLRSQNTTANCSFTLPISMSPSTAPSRRCYADPLLPQHCHRLHLLHYCLALAVGCGNNAREISNVFCCMFTIFAAVLNFEPLFYSLGSGVFWNRILCTRSCDQGTWTSFYDFFQSSNYDYHCCIGYHCLG